MFVLDLQDTQIESALNQTASNDEELYLLDFIKHWKAGETTYTFHTSGSTGKPKPIVFTRQQLESTARQQIETLQLRPTDYFLLCLHPATTGGTMLVLRALLLGARLAFIAPDISPLEHLDPDHPFTVASFVPTQLFSLIQSPNSIPVYNRFRMVLVGGASIPAAIEQQIAAMEPVTYHTYGMTETASFIALRKPGLEATFTPNSGILLRTTDLDCLCIQSKALGLDWIETQDRARIFPDGTFEITGRADDVIITGGKKVFPEKIERALAPFMNQVPYFIFGVPHPLWGQAITLFIEGEQPESDEGQSIKMKLKEQLDAHEIPKQLVYLPRFVYTQSGKVDKNATIKLLIY